METVVNIISNLALSMRRMLRLELVLLALLLIRLVNASTPEMGGSLGG